MKTSKEGHSDMTRTRKDTGGADEHNDSGNFVHPVAEKAPRNRVLEEVVDTGENSMDAGSLVTDGDSQFTQSPTPSQETVGGSRRKKKAVAPKKPRVWTDGKEHNLIELMKDRVYMFDLNAGDYHNKYKKRAGWAHIVKELGIPGEHTNNKNAYMIDITSDERKIAFIIMLLVVCRQRYNIAKHGIRVNEHTLSWHHICPTPHPNA